MKGAEKAAASLSSAQRKRELQDRRLAELQELTAETWQKLRQQMAEASRLPKLQGHMDKHGEEFAELGIADAVQMEALFLEHVRRPDLVYFTYISTQSGTQYRMWTMAAMDNGVVALYNESRSRHWSILRASDIREYLDNQRGWWVKVREHKGRIKVQRWRRP